ncbi:hypothetical protein LguiB_027293 [Lonicera macranthoides]
MEAFSKDPPMKGQNMRFLKANDLSRVWSKAKGLRALMGWAKIPNYSRTYSHILFVYPYQIVQSITVVMKVYINCVEGTMNTTTSGRVSEKKGVSSKRKMKDNISRNNKKQSRAVKKIGKKSGGVGKSAVKKVSRPTVFRCNLAAVVEEVNSLKGRGEIKNGHIEAMMKTPFGSMFKAIFDDKIIPDHIGMIGQVGKEIISAYSEKHSAFLIAGEEVKLTPDDVSFTFGLPKHGSKIIPRSSESVCGSEFMQRRFKGESSLKVSSVLSAVRSTVLEDGAEEDFARCLILYLLATVFFANSNRALALSFVPCVEDLDKVADFQWATIIHDHLMKMVKKNFKDPIRTPGCVIQLLYWFCEHYNGVQPYDGHSDDTPRFVRWNINILRRILYESELADLDASKVSKEIGNISAEEEVLLSPHYADKAGKDMKAIEWHTPEAEVVKEGAGKGDDKDKEIKDLKKRAAELEMMLKLSKRKDFIDPEFVFCDKPEEDDPDSYVDLVCSGVRGDLQFETPSKEQNIREKEKGEEKKMRSIIRKKENEDEGGKKDEGKKNKRRKTKKGGEPKQDLLVEKDSPKDVGVDVEKETVKKSPDVKGEEKKEGDLPSFDLNIDLSRESAKEDDSLKENFEKIAEQDAPAAIEKEVINVDELPIGDDEVAGNFLPLSKRKDRLVYLDDNEREVVETFFKNANKSYQGVRDDIPIFIKDCLEDEIFKMPVETKYLMFPMNHGRSLGDSGGYHWTLLVFNLPSLRWIHYNTMLPRRRAKQSKKLEDHYYEEAVQMKKAVMKRLKDRGDLKLKDTKVIRAECVQQGEDPDCALFVCEFIERLLRGEEVPKAMDIKLMQMKRAKITHLLLSDKDHSWEPEVKGVPNELAKEAIDDKSADKGGGCGDSVNSIIDDVVTFVAENPNEFNEFDE